MKSWVLVDSGSERIVVEPHERHPPQLIVERRSKDAMGVTTWERSYVIYSWEGRYTTNDRITDAHALTALINLALSLNAKLRAVIETPGAEAAQ